MEQGEYERVKGWLEDVTDTVGGDDEIIKNSEFDETSLHEEVATPKTPPRQLASKRFHEEVSPTDSSYSNPSIFDPPSRSHQLSKPSPQERFFDNTSETTSLTTDDNETLHAESFSKASLFPLKNATHQSLLPAPTSTKPSFETNTYNNRNAIAVPNTKPPAPHLPQPSTQTRYTTLLSCLQCVLSSLPCSRTLPSCTRCTRNKHAVCLMQRRRFPSEVHSQSFTFATAQMPVLLITQNDNAALREEKVKLRDELLEKWREREDKRNWVLPRVCSESRGGLRKGVLEWGDAMGRRHP